MLDQSILKKNLFHLTLQRIHLRSTSANSFILDPNNSQNAV
jgi:hypothetical protein